MHNPDLIEYEDLRPVMFDFHDVVYRLRLIHNDFGMWFDSNVRKIGIKMRESDPI